MNVYGLSWHFDRDKAKELDKGNGFNPGAGVRWQPEPLSEKFSWFLDAGAYHDSGRNTAVLAGAGLHWHATERLRLGGALVFFNSETYNSGRPFIAPLPIAAWDFGRVTLNMAYMPKVRTLNDINTLGFWATVWLR